MEGLGDYLLYAAICVLLSVITLLALTRQQRAALLAYLPLTSRGRRASTSKTPPRSLSPEKKIPSNAPPPQDYKDVFPPSSRETLAKAAESSTSSQKEKLLRRELADGEFKKGLISFTADYRECGPSTYTPTEISIEEIKALGDFPDYARLSGVPLPRAYPEFDIDRALARPYRPLRWAYHQTMSLTKLEPDWWLELENSYRKRITQRVKFFEKHGKLVLDYLPGTELACKEIMEMALQFLCARYPHYFSLSNSDERGYIFHNGVLKTETIINSMHPLHVLLHNVPEDFACMIRNPEDGKYYFRAGLLCSALGWNVSTKLGLQLKEIHAPIPDYREKMEFSMDRYFSKLPPSRPIQRGSWGLEVSTPLFMPPGDPHECLRLSQSPTLSLSDIYLRIDWQTLRRLPLSGCIVFNFKALFTQVEEFRDEKYIPALLRKILLEGKKSLMEYKSTWHVEHVVLPELEKWEKEQVEKGIAEEDWEVSTLEESPWFEGWEEKWHSQQGF
ncbi:MAG: hypothetical protein MMC33_003746 [Icmadophila ericetorum]|nr:hypothetical protein [Icmadophila ericetorum]